ncbi:glutaredoxin domain-containing protein [Candidatus Mesenet endosymbiont of Phosphuga atrata]|uniref:glutaredoxin domain-containing protein n=1 Tax=Candidatus Mesenet endosymbiont of Phosphuga atrata TaxID=3066221 RepID=UPI0030D4DEDC
MAHTKPVVIYTIEGCRWCIKAKALLDEKQIQYQEFIIRTKNGEINYDLLNEMKTKSNNAATVPQIFIGDEHIGGYGDLEKLNAENKLDKMLQDYSFYMADIYENDMDQLDALDIVLRTNYDDIL